MRAWSLVAAAVLIPRLAWSQTTQNAGAFAQALMNPDISVITDFAFAATNVKDSIARSLAIPGFVERSDRSGKAQGFDFNYLEMSFKGSVDPYFDYFGVVTVADGGVEVEEAYVDTRALPWGLGLRAGKMLSAFGRLNGMHKHFWDFYDAPLVYEVVTGGEGIKNPGLRVSWTAPVDFLLQLNLEVLQASFDASPTFGTRGYEITAQNGTVLTAAEARIPWLYAGSLKTSFDFGKHVFLLGGSLMYGPTAVTSIEGKPEDRAFTADGTILYDAELTYKYLISSYRSVALQIEQIGRHSSGWLALASDGLIHTMSKDQGGLTAQLVWRFDEPGRWRVGARWDLLAQNSVAIDGVHQDSPGMLARYGAMLEFSPTEFSRLRLQYNYDRSRYQWGTQKDVHELVLQVNVAIGPHGAHSF